MSDLINKESYALCLVAYLYRCYQNKDPVLNYPSSDLPHGIAYSKPTSAKEYLLTAQCKVNRTVREYLLPVFQRTYRKKCGSVENFSSYLNNSIFHQLIRVGDGEFSTPMKLLARFALATELVLCCFQNNCYRLSNYLPDYLHAILWDGEFVDIFTSLTKDDISYANAVEDCDVPLVSDAVIKEVKSLPFPGYIRLKNYCQALNGEENHQTLVTFREFGNAFLRGLQPAEIGVLRPEPRAREQEVRNCNVCGESDCSKYLKEFIDRCVVEYGNCNTC